MATPRKVGIVVTIGVDVMGNAGGLRVEGSGLRLPGAGLRVKG